MQAARSKIVAFGRIPSGTAQLLFEEGHDAVDDGLLEPGQIAVPGALEKHVLNVDTGILERLVKVRVASGSRAYRPSRA